MKTKARFGRLVRRSALKQIRFILQGIYKSNQINFQDISNRHYNKIPVDLQFISHIAVILFTQKT